MGGKEIAESFTTLDNPAIILTALKKASSGPHYIIRLYETSGTAQTAMLYLPLFRIHSHIEFSPFEIKTFRLDPTSSPLLQKAI